MGWSRLCDWGLGNLGMEMRPSRHGLIAAMAFFDSIRYYDF